MIVGQVDRSRGQVGLFAVVIVVAFAGCDNDKERYDGESGQLVDMGYSGTDKPAGTPASRAKAASATAAMPANPAAVAGSAGPTAEPDKGASGAEVVNETSASETDVADDETMAASVYPARFRSSSAVPVNLNHKRAKAMAAAMKTCDGQVTVTGHTDGVGGSETNTSLSGSRAAHVAELLVADGVPQDKIAVENAGASSPVDSDDTPEGRSHNRRVTVACTPASGDSLRASNNQAP